MSVSSLPHDQTQIEEDGNEANTQLLELQDAVVSALTSSGVLGRLRAQLRASTIGLLRGDNDLIEVSVGKVAPFSSLSFEHRVMLLLVKEFLEKGGYAETLGIFEAESSVRLLGEEENAAIQSAASQLDSRSTVLEQLIIPSLNNIGSLPTAKTERRGSAGSEVEGHDGEVAQEPEEPEEPDDAEVTHGLQGYEPSLSFSDEEGPLDPKKLDDIETLCDLIHMLKFSPARLCAPQSGFQSLLQALSFCGIEPDELPKQLSDINGTGKFCVLKPLFTNNFDFFNGQLTLRGDVVVDDYLTRHLMAHGVRRGAVVTVNSARLMQSVFHNHFSLRLLSKRLNFESIATPLHAEADARDGAAGGVLIEASRPDVQPRDVAGTSFHVVPLAGSQSPLGWKFSHFVGCLDQLYGTQKALAALDKMYLLSSAGNMAHRAEDLLLQCVEHFPAMNLAEALLAAQEMPVRFATRTREVAAPAEAFAEGHPSNSSSSPHVPDADSVAVTGFGAHSSVRDGSAKAAGSGGEGWALQDTPHDLAKTKEWVTRENALVGSTGDDAALSCESSDGWLDFSAQQREKKGPAHAKSTEFLFKQTFADLVTSPPVDGKVISKRKFKTPIRDPRFYDKMSDLRNGVPLDVGGKSVGAYLDEVRTRRHLFEVSMFVGKGSGKLAGKAISARYTLARESAARAYLGSVLQDLALLK